MGRNSKGRAGSGVRAVSETTIEISFMYNGKRCRERVKLEPSPANLKRAEQHKGAIEFAIAHGTFDYAKTFPNSKRAGQVSEVPSARMPFAKYFDLWLAQNSPRFKTSTAKTFYFQGQRIKEAVGHIPLGELRRRHLREWYSQQSGVKNRTFACLTSIVRNVIGQACEDELLEENPFKGWNFKGKEEQGEEYIVDPFSAAEQAAILGVLSGQRRNLVQFALWTGLRTSELVALEWGDVDFINREVAVTKAQTRWADAAESTKTPAGRRLVKLHGPALAALKDQKQYTFLNGGERIFLNPTTLKPWSGDGAIRYFWVQTLKRAGVRYRIPYQTRHTFASMMLSAGESPLWVARQMGHSNWLLIGRTYGKWMPDANPDAGSKAEAMYAAASDRGEVPAMLRPGAK